MEFLILKRRCFSPSECIKNEEFWAMTRRDYTSQHFVSVLSIISAKKIDLEPEPNPTPTPRARSNGGLSKTIKGDYKPYN